MMETICHWIDGKAAGQLLGPQLVPCSIPPRGRSGPGSRSRAPKRWTRPSSRRRMRLADWSDTSLTKRAQIMFGFRSLLDEARYELAEIIASEHGKTKPDARGEVQRGLETVEFVCGLPQLLKGDNSIQVSTGVDLTSTHASQSASWAASRPSTFPAMVPLWMIPNRDRVRQHRGFEALREGSRRPRTCWLNSSARAGLPNGVLNVDPGRPNRSGAS